MQAEITRQMVESIKDMDGVAEVQVARLMPGSRVDDLVKIMTDDGQVLRFSLSWTQDEDEEHVFEALFPPAPAMASRR